MNGKKPIGIDIRVEKERFWRSREDRDLEERRRERRWREETARMLAELTAAGVTESAILDAVEVQWEIMAADVATDRGCTVEQAIEHMVKSGIDGAEVRAHAIRRLHRERFGA